MQDVTIPEGFMLNPKGHWVPKETIDPLDLLRDEEVRAIMAEVEALQVQMREAKAAIEQRIADFMALSRQQYGVTLGGQKGNLSLPSYDASLKVVLSVSESIAFDERIAHAQALVTECLREWSSDSVAELKAIVEEAFQADKDGNINRWQIMRLLKIESQHEKWQQAMQAIRDSMYVNARKEYVRFYRRQDAKSKYELVALDFAAL